MEKNGRCLNCFLLDMIAQGLSPAAIQSLSEQVAASPARDFLKIPFKLTVTHLHINSKGAKVILEHIARKENKAPASDMTKNQKTPKDQPEGDWGLDY